MCMSCVKQNMMLNDQYIRSSDSKEGNDTSTKRETNNNTLISDSSNNNTNDESNNVADPATKPELSGGQESSPSEDANELLLTTTTLADEQWKRTSAKRKEAQEKKSRFLVVPPNHLPDLPSDLAAAKKMKRSFSFGGFGVFTSGASFGGVTSQELESMFDPVSKKEPSKTSKKQIKEYAQKYKHLKGGKDKKLPWYRDPLEYTQPAHLVTCIAIIYLAFRLFPDSRRSSAEASTLTRLLYVSSVSAVFGAQFWMTFFSGLALFFSIPRHMFAKVQSVLFPLYFLTNAALMMVAIITYTQHRPTHLWDTHQLIQGAILVFDFIVNLGIRLYLAPILTKLITIKIAIELEAGLGNEVGSSHPGVLSRCPHYMRLHKAFRRTHVIIAIGNMASMASTSFHLYYLATKLCSYDV